VSRHYPRQLGIGDEFCRFRLARSATNLGLSVTGKIVPAATFSPRDRDLGQAPGDASRDVDAPALDFALHEQRLGASYEPTCQSNNARHTSLLMTARG